MDITAWRMKIDEIDSAMLHLLNLRAHHALEVARVKNMEGLALRVPARERAILARMKRLNPGPLDGAAVVKIYKLILAESIRAQQRLGRPVAPAKRRRMLRASRVKKKSR
jgi:chorismate mutase